MTRLQSHGSGAAAVRRSNRLSAALRAINLAGKLALAAFLLAIVLRPDLPAMSKVGMSWRASTYPLVILTFPTIYWALARSHNRAYPHGADALITLPFLVDSLSDAAGVYDAIESWDQVVHAGAAAAIAATVWLLARSRTTPLIRAGLAVGGSAVAAILWELAQYATGLTSGYLDTAYVDTIGDLAWDLAGAVAVALVLLVVPVVRRYLQPDRHRMRHANTAAACSERRSPDYGSSDHLEGHGSQPRPVATQSLRIPAPDRALCGHNLT